MMNDNICSEILSSITDGIAVFDKDWHYVYLNDASEKLLGKSREELIGKKIWDLYPKTKDTIFGQKYLEVMQSRKSQYCTDFSPEFNKWFAANIYPTKDGIIIYYRDITEEKFEENKIKESEVYYRALIDSMPFQVWTATPDGKLDYVNGLVLKYFQKSFDEIIGEGWQKGVHPEDIPPVTRAWTRSLQTGEDYHVEFRLKQGSDGEYRRHIARAVAFKDASGKITKWFGANTDIHQFKESEERFRQLAENIDEVFWMTDPTKNSMLYISPGYEKIWGRTVDSLYQNPKQWIDAIVPEDRDSVLDAAMKKQTAGTYDEEYRITRNDGTIRWIHDKAYPIRDEKGNVYRVVGIATDITDQKKTQEKIQENLATIEKLNSFMVGRELKLVELKQEIEELKQKVNTS